MVIRNPYSVRPWQHVLEPVIGYLLLGAHLAVEPLQFSQAYNFGPHLSDALPVEEMLKLAIESWGRGEYIIEYAENQPHEAGLLKLDISKANNELKWQPTMNAQQAVSMTMDWYAEFERDKVNISEFTTKQIKEFIF